MWQSQVIDVGINRILGRGGKDAGFIRVVGDGFDGGQKGRAAVDGLCAQRHDGRFTAQTIGSTFRSIDIVPCTCPPASTPA